MRFDKLVRMRTTGSLGFAGIILVFIKFRFIVHYSVLLNCLWRTVWPQYMTKAH